MQHLTKIPFPKPGGIIPYAHGEVIRKFTDGQITWFVRVKL